MPLDTTTKRHLRHAILEYIALLTSGNNLSVYQYKEIVLSLIKYRYNSDNYIIHANMSHASLLAKVAFRKTRAGARLKNEFQWYYSQTHTMAITLFPELVDFFETNKWSVLVLSYVPHSECLRDAFIQSSISEAGVISILDRIFRVFDITLDGQPRKHRQNLQLTVVDRLIQRRSELDTILKSNTAYTHLYKGSIQVNNVHSATINEIYETLIGRTDAFREDTVSLAGISHGDLHFENILVGSNTGFVLIDPNYSASCFPEYDIGKILQSVHGLYDLIHSSLYSLIEKQPLVYELRFPSKTEQRYIQLGAEIDRYFTNLFLGEDNYRLIYSKARFICVAHFFCLLPHHVNNPSNFVSLLARLVELFCQWIRE